MVKAYYLGADESEGEAVDIEYVSKRLGVHYWKLNADTYEADGVLDQICEERGYSYRDFVDSDKIPNLGEKLPMFFAEHMHDDEEIRFFLGGSGYFDVRDELKEEQWIRIECATGDLIVLPAGIYHRFKPDHNMKFNVMRLFVGEPVWTAHNRGEDTDVREARRAYQATVAGDV